ncbi:helix-turn-helix domain-containing protein [Rhizobium leguminosarum]|uniref:helix-turn-helix domain-containing protein n=1 Tax=Rhizobium leguminosarum TaxID=384 RepID=UPI00293DC43E|nr:helix-turn-helix domain-containing protein [Rhizobium leguminosarum]MDV4166209.1 helix-turn-helix domain-containing protein [Rhizobium leguminosarum]
MQVLRAQHERYMEVRARLFATPPKTKHLMIVGTPIMLAPIPEQRAWQREEVQQDLHVQTRNRRLSEMAANGPKVYVKDRCRELGVSFAEVVGAGRRHKISLIRHRLIWEVAQHFGLSYPALGRLFGGRDHTSCLYAVRRIEALNSASTSDK